MKLKTKLWQYCMGVSFLLICFSNAHGQGVNEKYETEAIYLKGSKYVKNGVEYRIVSWNKELKKEMEVSPDAVMEYAKFLQKRKTAFLLSTIGVVSIASSLFVDNNNDVKYILLLGGLGVTIVSIPINHKAGNSLQKAIWLRNRDVLN